MAKVKISKKSASIDMTAMCDVSFLLLSFFIMSSTARVPEPLPVDMPASTVQTKLPESDLATITVGQGKYFFGVTGTDVRKRTLELMGEKYKLQFTPEEANRFALIDEFGVPIAELKGLIALNGSERNVEGLQKGIPADSTNNQLKEWILNARIATKELAKVHLNVAVKGDAKEQYPEIKRVIDILQDQKLNKFRLVTSLRSDDF